MRQWHPTLHRAAAFARREVLAVSAVVALATLTGVFIEITQDVVEGDSASFDRAVLMALRDANTHDPIGPAWLTTAAIDLTSLGSIAVLALVVLTISGLFFSLNHWRRGSIMLAASVGGLVWSQSLKAIFSRARPEELYRVVDVVNASFPSGHATLSASIYLTLGAMVASFAQKKRVRAFALTTAIFAAFIVGATRVYLGVHWFSDVIAGWCLGGAWALACWLALWIWDRGWMKA